MNDEYQALVTMRLSTPANSMKYGCANQLHETEKRGCYMQGMGEPLNNYDQVSAAVHMMIDPQTFALRRSAVTVSTVGVIPRMLQMMDDLPGVSLALSLHAPTQELRKTIVPSAKAYPLDRLMAAVDKYHMQTRQKVTQQSLICKQVLNCCSWDS